MSQECAGSSVGLSVDERLNSMAWDKNSFADLIRAREDQQRRIRDALEEQNRQLRARLATEGTTCQGGGGTTGLGFSNRHRAASPPAKQHTTVIPIEEFITFVTEMKDLVNYSQQADLVALHALQDRVEFQNRNLAQRMTELEAQMIALHRRDELFCTTATTTTAAAVADGTLASFKARSYVDTVGEPCLQYVLHELGNVRNRADEAMERVRLSDEVLERQQTAVHHLEKDLNTLEVKMVDLESAPNLFRRETIALEERYTEFTRRLRQDLVQQQQQQQQQSTGNVEHQMRQLEKHVLTVERAVAALEGRASDEAKDSLKNDVLHNISCLVDEKLQGLRESVEGVLHTEMAERERSLGDALGKRVEDLRSANATAMAEMLERLQAIEATTRAVDDAQLNEVTALDEDRIELLTKELEGATVVLEGAIAKRASSGRDGIILESMCLSDRLAKVESQAHVLEEKMNYTMTKLQDISAVEAFRGSFISGPKAAATTTTTTTHNNAVISASAGGSGGNGCNEDSVESNAKRESMRESVPCQLPGESWLAAAAAAVHLRPHDSEQPCIRFGIPAVSTPCDTQFGEVSPSLPPPPYTPSALAPRAKLRPATQHPSVPLPFGPFMAPPVPISSESTGKALAEIRERRRRKEEAVVKVIASLREIEQRFAALSEKESSARRRSAGSRRGVQGHASSFGRTDTLSLLELIADQKEAVHAKRGQLLGMRNTLWREIAELEEEERDFLAS